MMETYYPFWQRPTMCRCCGQYTTTPLWVTHRMGRGTMQYAFCNLEHANRYYDGKAKGWEP